MLAYIFLELDAIIHSFLMLLNRAPRRCNRNHGTCEEHCALAERAAQGGPLSSWRSSAAWQEYVHKGAWPIVPSGNGRMMLTFYKSEFHSPFLSLVSLTYSAWDERLQQSFEQHFYVPTSPLHDVEHHCDPSLVHKRGIYKVPNKFNSLIPKVFL